MLSVLAAQFMSTSVALFATAVNKVGGVGGSVSKKVTVTVVVAEVVPPTFVAVSV